MGVQARAQATIAIGERLDSLLAGLVGAAGGTVAAYWAMKDEPDLAGTMARWRAAGIAVALPRVVQADAPLEFAGWDPAHALQPGPFGTLHPAGESCGSPAVLIIPCLGFDLRCFRLGYGGGYYDRTLERMPEVRTIGVAYDCCEVEGFVAQAHDLPMGWVVTERRVLRRCDCPD